MKAFLTIVCIVFITAGCKKDNNTLYSSQGTLIGLDGGMCPFCGGIEITIKNDPYPNPPSFYRINGTIPNFNLGSNPQFPINVTLDWKRDTAVHAGNFIIVSRMKVVQ